MIRPSGDNSAGAGNPDPNSASTLATAAISLAKKATDEVKKVDNRMTKFEKGAERSADDIEALKDETSTKAADTDQTFKKVAERFRNLVKRVDAIDTTIQGLDSRCKKLEITTKSHCDLTPKEIDGIARLMMPRIEEVVRKVMAASRRETPAPAESRPSPFGPPPSRAAATANNPLQDKFSRGSAKRPIPVEAPTPTRKKPRGPEPKGKGAQRPAAKSNSDLFD